MNAPTNAVAGTGMVPGEMPVTEYPRRSHETPDPATVLPVVPRDRRDNETLRNTLRSLDHFRVATSVRVLLDDPAAATR